MEIETARGLAFDALAYELTTVDLKMPPTVWRALEHADALALPNGGRAVIDRDGRWTITTADGDTYRTRDNADAASTLLAIGGAK